MRYALLGVLVIVAGAAAVTLAVVLVRPGGSPPATTTQTTVTPIGPIVLSATGLKARAVALDQLIYWLGPVPGDRYELKRTTTGDVFVRYLPRGVRAGTDPGGYVEVGTYPYTGALAAIKASAKGRLLTVAGRKGAIAAVVRKSPTNVRVAFPGVDYQIEVYSPRPKAARELATEGALTPLP